MGHTNYNFFCFFAHRSYFNQLVWCISCGTACSTAFIMIVKPSFIHSSIHWLIHLIIYLYHTYFYYFQQISIKKLSPGGQKETGLYLATPLGIAVCSIALIVIIAIGIVVLRKRVCTAPVVSRELHDVTTAPPSAVPPTSVLATAAVLPPAQMNGYENPTHKYLEQKAMDA